MTYSGAVKVGGPANVHELTDLMISKVAVGPMNNNAYLLRCRATGEQLLIDAANEAGTLLQLIGDDSITSVVTTHQHGDHWQALGEVVAATGARTYAGRYDAEGIPVPTDVLVEDGDTIRVGRVALTARHLAGHTPGSIALVYDDPHGAPHLFTGTASSRAESAIRARTRRRSRACSTMWRPSSSTRCRTRPGSIRGTDTTPRSAPSGHICRSGASAAGDTGGRVPVGPGRRFVR